MLCLNCGKSITEVGSTCRHCGHTTPRRQRVGAESGEALVLSPAYRFRATRKRRQELGLILPLPFLLTGVFIFCAVSMFFFLVVAPKVHEPLTVQQGVPPQMSIAEFFNFRPRIAGGVYQLLRRDKRNGVMGIRSTPVTGLAGCHQHAASAPSTAMVSTRTRGDAMDRYDWWPNYDYACCPEGFAGCFYYKAKRHPAFRGAGQSDMKSCCYEAKIKPGEAPSLSCALDTITPSCATVRL